MNLTANKPKSKFWITLLRARETVSIENRRFLVDLTVTLPWRWGRLSEGHLTGRFPGLVDRKASTEPTEIAWGNWEVPCA